MKKQKNIILDEIMINYDIHIHTHLSSCGSRDAFISDYISAAKQSGLSLVGFADHAWDSTVDGASDWYKPQNYKRLAERKKEIENIEGIKVVLGAEGEFANFLLGLGEEGRQYVDYVIVPHSHTHMRGFVIPEDCAGNPEKHADFLIKSFLSICGHEKRGMLFGLAHPMYPIGDSAEYAEAVYSYISDNSLDECAYAAKEANLAVEANLSVLKGIPPEAGNEFCYRRFFEACKRAGCEFFLGSDAHGISAFTARHSEKEEAIYKIGLEEKDFTAALRHIPNV